MTTTDPATDPPTCDDPTDDPARDLSGGIERDPIRTWLRLAQVSHAKMQNLGTTYVEECRWRKECIRMAIAMGATEREVSERLGVSRGQVSKLAR